MRVNRIWGLILAVDIMRWQLREPVGHRKLLNSKELSKRPMQLLKPGVDSSKGLNLKLRWKHLLLRLLRDVQLKRKQSIWSTWLLSNYMNSDEHWRSSEGLKSKHNWMLLGLLNVCMSSSNVTCLLGVEIIGNQ